MKYCLLIPHYNHARQLENFLPQLRAVGLDCVIVDDGSDSENIALLQTMLDKYEFAHIFYTRRNRGKGAAVKAGFSFCRALGFTHVIQIDADGQHNAGDITTFVANSKQYPEALICGKPRFDQSAPKSRVYGRKVTDFWVALETLSLQIKDGLCGFRVYPLACVEDVLDHYFLGNRMDFDTEILVKSVWLNKQLIFVNTKVIYPESGSSHFNYLRDNLLLIRLHARLMVGMLLRFPWLLWQRFWGAK